MDAESMSPIEKKKKAVVELLEGHRLAKQLQFVLESEPGQDAGGSGDSSCPSATAQELLDKILRSFSESLSVLKTCEESQQEVGPHSNQLGSSWEDSRCSAVRRSEDSGESKKRSLSSKDRRGCHKRRKKAESWKIVSSSLEDGHAWRKYGQKDIHKAKYPRSYFRCTHKYTEDCKAVKQVQRLDDDSNLYEITYIGTHTCNCSAGGPPEATTLLQQSTVARNNLSDPNAGSNDETAGGASDHTHVTPKVAVKQEDSNKDEASISDEALGFPGDLWEDLVLQGAFDTAAGFPCGEATSSALDMEIFCSSVSGHFGSNLHFEAWK